MNWSKQDPELRQRVEDQEDLDEDRRVADDLDVDRRELAHDRDPVRAGGAEDEADHERAGDRDRRDLQRVDEPSRSSSPVLGDEGPEVVGEQRRSSAGAGSGRVGAAASRSATWRLRANRVRARGPAGAYPNVLFGRRMFFENAGTNRGGMLFLMIGMEMSFLLHQLEPRVDPALQRDVALLDPDPYGPRGRVSFVIFASDPRPRRRRGRRRRT